MSEEQEPLYEGDFRDRGSARSNGSNSFSKRELVRQFVTYCLVGLVSNGTAFLAYLGLTYLGLGPLLAMTIVYVVAMSIAFIGNKDLTFRFEGSEKIAVLRFIGVYFVGYLVNAGLMLALHNVLGLPHQLVLAINLVIVAVLLFLAMRVFVFKSPRDQNFNAKVK